MSKTFITLLNLKKILLLLFICIRLLAFLDNIGKYMLYVVVSSLPKWPVLLAVNETYYHEVMFLAWILMPWAII